MGNVADTPFPGDFFYSLQKMKSSRTGRAPADVHGFNQTIHVDTNKEGMQTMHDWRYEEKVVKALFRRFGVPEKYKWQFLNEYKAATGRKRLTLAYFCTTFPTFPIYLESSFIPFIKDKCTVTDIFSGFDKTVLFQEFEILGEILKGTVEYRHVGIVFFWPHLRKCGGLVLHNRPINTQVPGTRLLWVSKAGEQLVLEPLNVLLDTLDLINWERPWEDEDAPWLDE